MENIHQEESFLKFAFQRESLKRAVRVAVLVGIILNIINNPLLFQLSFERINIYRVLLTFIVPFCVSLYSSVLANREKCPENVKELTQRR